MQHKSNFKSQVFNDFKERINSLSQVNSIEDLLLKSDEIQELQELFTTLKVIQKYPDTISENEEELMISNNQIILEEEATSTLEITEEEEEENVVIENSIEEEEEIETPSSVGEENVEQDEQEINNEIEENNEEVVEIVEEVQNQDNQENEQVILEEKPVEEVEEEYEEKEIEMQHQESVEEELIEEEELMEEMESLEKEIAKAEEQLSEQPVAVTQEEKDEKEKTEKKLHKNKLRLATIKGLKNENALFDEETLDSLVQLKKEEKIVEPPKASKQDFKLDLNDKIAFSKILFDGRQTELNETINILNSFETIEEAQEYLSDVYYKKRWDRVDEYAQRLWSLVENKFH